MPTIDQARHMAKRLRAALAVRDVEIPHATGLELVAAQLGYNDWNTAAARLDPGCVDGISFAEPIPILRIFDLAKANEFYCEFLGFVIDGDQGAIDRPAYFGVKRGTLELHLSEHHGDASPGSTVFVAMSGVQALHAELAAKNYDYGRPGVEKLPWGQVLEVHDPFGNRIRFCERRR